MEPCTLAIIASFLVGFVSAFIGCLLAARSMWKD